MDKSFHANSQMWPLAAYGEMAGTEKGAGVRAKEETPADEVLRQFDEHR
jgi:hypothetical protein